MANLDPDNMKLRERCLKMAIERHPTINNYAIDTRIGGQPNSQMVTVIDLLTKEADKFYNYIREEVGEKV